MSDSMDRLAAALSDSYAIEHELGAGGMATVYLAHDVKHNRKVAVKVLRPELAAVIGAERFLKEIEVTANLQHPHILPLHDSGEVNGTVFYVMPFVEGESLRDLLNREKQLRVVDAVRIATEVAGALDYAHRKGIVHRDIKPENILLHDGRALVVDFGIALAAANTGARRMTETGMLLGTPHYMSPEQAVGERHLDARTDIYALGCVLYEMLAGEPPFDGPTAQAIVAKVMSGPPEPVTNLRTTVPVHVAAAIETALQKLPADRFASAEAFAVGLDRAPGGIPVLRPSGDSMRVRVARAGGVGLLVGAALAFIAAGLFRGDRPGNVATVTGPTRRLEISLPPGHFLCIACGPPIAVSHDGSMVAFSALGPDGARLFIRRLAAFEAVMIEGSDGGQSPFFSPDDEWIGFFTPTALKRVHVDGGTPQEITRVRGYFGSVGSWGDNDSIVISTGVVQGLLEVPAQGGMPRRLTELRANDYAHGGPHVLPGGKGILFTVATDDSSFVAAFDPETGDWRPLVPGAGPQFVMPDRIVFTRFGTLWTAFFDPDRLVLTSAATPLPDRAESFGPGSLQLPHVSVSASGVIGYVPFTNDEANRLVWVGRDGGVTPAGFELQGHHMYPDIGPDGRRLVVALSQEAGERSVRLVDLRSGGSSIVSETPLNFVPTWTRDGTMIAYNSPTYPRNILARVADRREQVERIVEFPDTTSVALMGRWGAGRTMAFVVLDRETGFDIWTQDVGAGTAAVPFAQTAAHEGGVSFSPDGSWLAFVSDEQGRYEVYARRVDGSSGTIPVSVGGGQEPIWSADGREIFYRTPNHMMVVEVTWVDGEPQCSQPRVLFEGAFELTRATQPNYDVTADGQRFVMVQRTAGRADLFHIITNEWH